MRENGLKFLRFLLLISSVSPVFALLAIRGSEFDSEWYNTIYSMVLWGMVVISFLPLFIRCKIAKDEKVVLNISEHVLPCTDEYSTYILSIALPLCQNNLESINQLPYFIAMIVFVLVVFYIFNLYYLNLFFYLLGYKLYKITSEKTHSFVVITKKDIQEIINKKVVAIRLTNSLFWEKESD